MGIRPAHQRRRLEELNSGDVGNAQLGQRHDLVAGAGGDAEDLGLVVQETHLIKCAKEVGEGVDLVLPGLGGPEALVLLVEREDDARRGVAGGFGEAEVGLRGRVRRDAGVGGFEEEEDEGDGADEYGDVGEPLQENLDVPLHNGGDRKKALYRWRSEQKTGSSWLEVATLVVIFDS
ncbi:hypothetical protein DVH24_032282 [Malus domestica]|uniref:Uncharacterized protein n=1 Tax=Malus domestica TaxID=3750 RepID=A0A498J5D3_MALDO|nr:hypothetical protein DVH24_032282 [Malus domestica]